MSVSAIRNIHSFGALLTSAFLIVSCSQPPQSFNRTGNSNSSTSTAHEVSPSGLSDKENRPSREGEGAPQGYLDNPTQIAIESHGSNYSAVGRAGSIGNRAGSPSQVLVSIFQVRNVDIIDALAKPSSSSVNAARVATTNADDAGAFNIDFTTPFTDPIIVFVGADSNSTQFVLTVEGDAVAGIKDPHGGSNVIEISSTTVASLTQDLTAVVAAEPAPTPAPVHTMERTCLNAQINEDGTPSTVLKRWVSVVSSDFSSSDDKYVDVNLGGADSSQVLIGWRFNFRLPNDSLVKGVSVTMERSGSVSASIATAMIKIGMLTGFQSDSRANGTDLWSGPKDEVVTFGSNSDLWGLTSLSPADVNSGKEFGFRFQAVNVKAAGTANVEARFDTCGMAVSYTCPSISCEYASIGL